MIGFVKYPKEDLRIGKVYKFEDVDYIGGFKGHAVKKGILQQITDRFAVMNNGRYCMAVFFENIKGECK
jgi:hypothetical protein